MKLQFLFYLSVFPVLCFAQETKSREYSNRYAMKMTKNDDGSYALINAGKYARFIDVKTIPDVMEPYIYQPDRLKSRDYKGVFSKDIVYKKHENYELTLTVDFADGDKPAPFVVYLHGGGWARGNNTSHKALSHYMAKQKGITGIRVSYTLASQAGVTVEISLQDVADAVNYVREHAVELNVNPDCFGFVGTSAGAHLAAMTAMTIPETKAFVGYSGIYDLEKAAIVMRTKDVDRIAYFRDRDEKVLHDASPVNRIPKTNVPASMLVCGTCDVTVEWEQSEIFAKALRRKGGVCNLLTYEYYDHNLSSKASDKMEEIFFKTVDFLTAHLK